MADDNPAEVNTADISMALGPGVTVLAPPGQLDLTTQFTVLADGEPARKMGIGALDVLSGGKIWDALAAAGLDLLATPPSSTDLVPPPPVAASSAELEVLLAASWREYLHPRDRLGRFIEKGDIVDLPGGAMGQVVDVDPQGMATVRLPDGRQGRISVDRLERNPLVEEAGRRAERAARIAKAANATQAAAVATSLSTSDPAVKLGANIAGKVANIVGAQEHNTASYAYGDLANVVSDFDKREAAKLYRTADSHDRIAGYQRLYGFADALVNPPSLGRREGIHDLPNV